MRDLGEFEILGAPAGSEVAVRSADSEWILGHVIQFRPDVGYYGNVYRFIQYNYTTNFKTALLQI